MAISYSQNLTNYNQILQAFIKALEGQYLAPYVDSVGVPTVGWGQGCRIKSR